MPVAGSILRRGADAAQRREKKARQPKTAVRPRIDALDPEGVRRMAAAPATDLVDGQSAHLSMCSAWIWLPREDGQVRDPSMAVDTP